MVAERGTEKGATMHTRTDAKGRITLPSFVRKHFGIKKGTRISIEINEQKRIILTPITREYIHSLRGSLRGKGAIKMLMENRRREREL